MIEKLLLVRKLLQFLIEYPQDFWVFLRYNNFSPLEEEARRLAHKAVIETHAIEKGLSIPHPRPYFGSQRIRSLLRIHRRWNSSGREFSRAMFVGALRDYSAMFSAETAPESAVPEEFKAFLLETAKERGCGGVRSIGRTEGATNFEAVSFLQRRFSARDFGNAPLTDCELRKVITLSQRAPSQCNRQATRFHVYRNPARIRRLLKLQGGARGFLEIVPTLFVVTSEITAWGGPQQRNQLYVDGGIQAMMLLLALDAYGLVSCPLNLAVDNRQERRIKAEGRIPARERVVVMVAAGRPPARALKAARSPRLPLRDVATLHKE